LEALVAELRELVPHVMKPKRTKKAAPRFDWFAWSTVE
jgi:hypothetical protein